jgi:hypothetical protein
MKNTNTCKVRGDGRTFYFETELTKERKMKSAEERRRILRYVAGKALLRCLLTLACLRSDGWVPEGDRIDPYE